MSEMNIDSLLDSSIDDLCDLPEFSIYPAGMHTVAISWEKKEVNKHPALELKMRLIETVELAQPEADTPPNPGAESSVLYMLDNEFSQGKLKAIMKSLAAELGTGTISETIEASRGMEVNAVCKVRQNKDKTQSYNDIVKFMF